MFILGLTKTTLLDYPGRVAASVFTGGGNFRCPYCHNKDIILNSRNLTPICDELFSFLNKRRNVLTGVCITGGEPTLHDDLPHFIERIRSLGYQIKLDTNGTNPRMLETLIADRLIDYCAMDIKNSPPKYAPTVGLDESSVSLSDLYKSVDILLSQSTIHYEFRTTIVKEFHEEADMLAIAKWLRGAESYFLQSYVDSDGVLCRKLHAHSKETLESFLNICRPYIPNTTLRG